MQDPLASDFASWTPYHYVHNNPIKYIDPTGMAADGYTVDDEGYLKKVNNEGRNEKGENEYDVVYAKNDYSEEKKTDYDNTGERTGLKISSGIIESKQQVGKWREWDLDGTPTNKTGTVDIFKIKDDKEAVTIHKFLDQKTNVEWSNSLLRNNKTGNQLNILLTSHLDYMAHFSKAMDFSKSNNYILIRNDHNHPNDNIGSSSEDRDTRRNYPNAIFRILVNGSYKKY